MNRHAHLLVKKLARARFGDEWTQEQLREAKAEIQQMISDALRDHKSAKRKMAAAVQLKDSDEAVGLRAGQALSTALEPTSLDSPVDLPVLSSAVLLPTFNVSRRERGAA